MKIIKIDDNYNITDIKDELKSNNMLLLDFSNLEKEDQKSKFNFSIGLAISLDFYIENINSNKIILHKEEFLDFLTTNYFKS